MNHSPAPNIFETDDWEVGQGQIDGAHHIVRMRSTLPSLADQELFSKLIIVTWRYESEESGMPDSDTHRRMQRFEDALESGTEARGTAFQAVSITGAGRKEWRYYAADTDAFMGSLNQDLRGHEEHPLEIASFLDPEWNALREFHSRSAQ
ncbi:DUF695 domain-containing protein [Paucibacter sp. R3-3]|uniref:DUF695 domain-containing protein n=1 Tax=Roseateles agri TaxID=3098619 RepID=A0ABU5DI22_9BURK|nr:DUF695 domain-containing protein [Paucibacter sp. R3-3]MDY0745943.1 DUF695 domain-containing protein [Paucibacter sp. R3-3]